MSKTTKNAPIHLDRLMAEVEKGQQLAGHFPDAEALERARRVYTGETSADAARAEVDAKYSTTEAQRRFAVEQAEHSGEMEGLHISPEARADAEEYIEGRISSDELVARGRARYGLD